MHQYHSTCNTDYDLNKQTPFYMTCGTHAAMTLKAVLEDFGE